MSFLFNLTKPFYRKFLPFILSVFWSSLFFPAVAFLPLCSQMFQLQNVDRGLQKRNVELDIGEALNSHFL